MEKTFGQSLVPLHKSLGLTVLALSLARVAWRLAHRPPPLPLDFAPWKRRVSAAGHGTLYALMILVPLTGWLRVSSGTRPLNWFGLFDLPKFPIAPRSAEAAAASSAHQILGYALAALAVLHIAAALHHRFVLRDGLIRRMLP